MSRSSVVHRLLKSALAITWSSALAASHVGAQAPTAAPLTLGEVVTVALHGNPDIITARLHIDSAHGELRIARGFNNPTASVIPGVPFQYGLSSDIDIGPDRWYRVSAANHGYSATRFSSADTRRQVVFNVRSAFYDLLLADALAALAIDERTIYAQILIADSVRLRNGATAEANVVTSELNLARADAAVVAAQAGVRSARLTLQLLMGVAHPDTAFRIAGTLRYVPIDVATAHADSLIAAATTTRPDLLSADEQLRQSQAIRSEVNWWLLPTPNVGLSWQPQQSYPGAFPFGASSHFTLALSVPIPLWYWYGGDREKARAGLAVAQVADEQTKRQVAADVTLALDSLQAAAVLTARYQNGLLNKTQKAVETARYAYARGAISLLDLLDAVRTNQDIRTEYLTAVHNYWVAAYSLDRALGQDIISDEASPR